LQSELPQIVNSFLFSSPPSYRGAFHRRLGYTLLLERERKDSVLFVSNKLNYC